MIIYWGLNNYSLGFYLPYCYPHTGELCKSLTCDSLVLVLIGEALPV